jgi:hypothetical protein
MGFGKKKQTTPYHWGKDLAVWSEQLCMGVPKVAESSP